MDHTMNNPVWLALTSGNRHLSLGNDRARYLPVDISPFAAVRQPDPEHFTALYETVPFNDTIAIFTDEQNLRTDPWEVVGRIDGFQMVYVGAERPLSGTAEIVPLTERHVPEMLTLTKLTNPGPFRSRTIAFGNYEGIFHDGKLVAMAGQRLHSGNHVEISAVCTHPDFGGKGLARQLIDRQINHILARGEIPYLHVKGENVRAIRLYEAIGFEKRRKMVIYLLDKAGHGPESDLRAHV